MKVGRAKVAEEWMMHNSSGGGGHKFEEVAAGSKKIKNTVGNNQPKRNSRFVIDD